MSSRAWNGAAGRRRRPGRSRRPKRTKLPGSGGGGSGTQQVACFRPSVPAPMARQMESYPLCQLFSGQSGARGHEPAGITRQGPWAACRAAPPDGCVDRPISAPISLLPPPPAIHLDALIY
jgi:hypothetical protein